ncbi:MAG: MFS transporter [Anaerolineae bacterium]
MNVQLRWLRINQLSLVNRNIVYFTIDTALQGLMMGGIFGFISVFAVRLGASNFMVSLLTSLPALVMAVSSIPAGRIVEQQRDLVRYTNRVRISHRASFLLIAILPFFIAQGLVEVIVLIWAIKSIPATLLESSWMAVVAEVIPPERRARVNGVRWAILSVVTAGSTAAFGYVLDRLPFPLNYQIVFFVSFVGGMAGIYFFARLRIPENIPPERPKGEPATLRQRTRAYLHTMNVPAFVKYEIAATALRLGANLPSALYTIYWIRYLGASDLWIGWQATAGKLALIVGYIVWGRLISRKGYLAPLLICSTLLGLYPVLTGLARDQLWLPLIAIVQGFFTTGVDIAFFDTLLVVSPTERRPSFIALNTMLANLTIFCAPLMGNFLADWVGIPVVFFIAGGFHILTAVLFWRFKIVR